MMYQKKFPHGLMFHHFHDKRHHKGQGSISSKDFEKIICFVGRDRILDPSEWIQRTRSQSLKNQDLCITFDDALLCQFEIALPVLEKYGLKAFWSVYSDPFEGGLGKFEIYRLFRSKYFKHINIFYEIFLKKILHSPFSGKAQAAIEKTNTAKMRKEFPFYSRQDLHFRIIRDQVLTRAQYESAMDELILKKGLTLKILSKNLWMSNENLKYLHDHGHEIGLHSYTHPMVMANLPLAEQNEEYQKNFKHLNKILGRPPCSMAHPANSYNQGTITILQQLNITCGFRANISPPMYKHPQYELPREDHTNIIKLIKSKKI